MKDELTILLSEKAKRRSAAEEYFVFLVAFIFMTVVWLGFGVLKMYKVMKELNPEQGLLRFLPAVVMGLIIAAWAAVVALFFKGNKLNREMRRRLTGSIRVNETIVHLGTQSIPRGAIDTVKIGAGILYVKCTENGRKYTVNVPISWLPTGGAEAIELVLACGHTAS